MLVLKEERLASILEDEYDKTTKELLANSPTILLLGATGAGKSSLINAVFGCEKAPVGAGKPVTNDFEFYEAKDEAPINLYDSKGHETNDTTFNGRLYEFLDDRAKAMTNDITKGIHSVWYVVNAAQARWSPGDTDIANRIRRNFPLIVVLNKCDLATNEQMDAVEKVIRAGVPNVNEIIRISAIPVYAPASCSTHSDDDLILMITKKDQKKSWKCNTCGESGVLECVPQGLTALVKATALQMPEILRSSFINAQAQNLKQKDTFANIEIGLASAAAYAVGWSPIPFADAPFLIGIQLGMASSLAHTYGILKSAILPVIAGQMAAFGVGYSGASLLKFIPAVGTIAGGIIDSSFAIVMTLAVGLLYRAIFRKVFMDVAKGTAEERTTRLMELLKTLDIVSIFAKIRAVVGKVKFSNKGDIAQLLPSLGAEVDRIISEN